MARPAAAAAQLAAESTSPPPPPRLRGRSRLGPDERYREDVKKAVRFYVRKQLKQGIKEKKLRGLNKELCGKIEEKIAAKAVEGAPVWARRATASRRSCPSSGGRR